MYVMWVMYVMHVMDVMLCDVMWCYVMLCYVMYVASDRNHQQGATQATSDFGNRNHIAVPFNHCRLFLVPLFSFAARCSRTGPRSFRWSCSSAWEWCRCPYQCRTFCWQPGGRAAGAAGPTIVSVMWPWPHSDLIGSMLEHLKTERGGRALCPNPRMLWPWRLWNRKIVKRRSSRPGCVAANDERELWSDRPVLWGFQWFSVSSDMVRWQLYANWCKLMAILLIWWPYRPRRFCLRPGCAEILCSFWSFPPRNARNRIKGKKGKDGAALAIIAGFVGPVWICRCVGYGCMTCSYMFNLFPTFKHESTRDGCERCFRYLFWAGCAGKTIEPEHSNLFVGNLHKVLFAAWWGWGSFRCRKSHCLKLIFSSKQS